MKIEFVNLIYFSPTGTTEKVANAVSSGLKYDEIKHCNLTSENPDSIIEFDKGAAVIAVPVYAGRVPETFIERFSKVKASGIPAVIIAVYGNRAYEDALLELYSLAEANGFNVTAAGAFIGEHSYSNSEKPIAAGRPDKSDLDAASDFGRQVYKKLEKGDYSVPEIPGNFPHRDGVKSGSGIAPVTDEKLCVRCGRCEEVCPVHAVNVSDAVATISEDCIMCCACIKSCTAGARLFTHEMIRSSRDKLCNNCKEPKKPEIYI